MSNTNTPIQGLSSTLEVAEKLFREAGRLISAQSKEDAIDSFSNFIITHTALRDWYFKDNGLSGDAAHIEWNARAGGHFGICKELANYSKHNTEYRAVISTPKKEIVQAISAAGPHDEFRMQFIVHILKDDKKLTESHLLVSSICIAWAELLSYKCDDEHLFGHLLATAK